MAVDDIDILRDELPDLFEPRSRDGLISDDYVLVPVEDPDGGDLIESDLEERVPDAGIAKRYGTTDASTPGFVIDWDEVPPVSLDLGIFAGGYRRQEPDEPVPPPDAMAFYLPFHFFHPRWWGIYLLAEAIEEFGDWISRRSGGQLSRAEGFVMARLFAYGHEAFHHRVEAFATRLELAHRVPLYRAGFTRLYARVNGSDECVEEALANAAALQKVAERAFRKPRDPAKRRVGLQVLHEYVRSCPPGYRLGSKLAGEKSFVRARNGFAEQNLRESVPAVPGRGSGIWAAFPHAFGGISRVTSRVNYLVPRGSRIAQRSPLALRYLRHRDVVRKLERLAGCRFVRQTGSHEIWETPAGHRFPVPNHRTEIPDGTLRAILKQAGLDMSLREFLSPRG